MKRSVLLALFFFAATHAAAGTGRVIIVNNDGSGRGLNDPTPVSPVGGNAGTTLGEQRLNVFSLAAQRWSSVLDTNVDIRIGASFAALPCGETSVVLGSAGPSKWRADFDGAPRKGILYPAALANKFAGRDLDPTLNDISMQFNADLDKPTCAGDRGWYYGIDGKEGSDDALYPVVLHEIAHGLGLVGSGELSLPTVYNTFTLDRLAGRTWDQLTKEERLISSTNTANVVWNGSNVTTRAPQFLERAVILTVTQPTPVARNYDVGTASFGTPANRAALSGSIVAASDAGNEEGPSTLDGCTAYENASEVAGKIALVDRGTCTFVAKARAAQAAGAAGLIVVDNRKDTCLPPAMGGSGDDVTIPVISVPQDQGTALRNASGVSAMLRNDPSRMAGASDEGYVRLYAPCTFNAGSSISHWDTPTTPNLLMEPFINADLIDSVDLTIYQLMDLGWTQPPRTGRRLLRR